MPRFRRFAVLVVLLALACSGTALAASLAGPQVQVDAADQAWAAAAAVSLPDLGSGWKPSGTGIALSAADTGAESGCTASDPDESDLTVTGGWASPDFYGPGGAYVGSEAIVWSSADQAQADWDRTQQSAFLDCMAQGAVKGSTKQVKISVASKGALAFPAVAPRTAAYRLHLVYSAKMRIGKTKKFRTVKVPGNFDVVFVVNGRATAMLLLNSSAVAPISAAAEQQLATSVAARIATDPHA